MRLYWKLGWCLCSFSSVFLVTFIFSRNTESSASALEVSSVKVAEAPYLDGNSNKGRFPQLAPTVEPLPLETEQPLKIPAISESSSTESTQLIQVEKVEVTGSTIFNSDKLNSITKPVEGHSVTLGELRKVADQITQLYLEKGYISSRATLITEITSGVVKIQVIEGSIEKIEIQGTKRLNPDYVRSRVSLGAGKPLSTANLEDQLRLLRSDPLFSNVEASLRAGSGVDQSILVVRVTEAESFDAGLSVDNYSSPSVGSERLGVSASYGNLTGIGDELAASYYRTAQGGASNYDFSYRIPLNAMNGTLQLRTAINNNQVIQEPYSALNIRGESQLYDISYRQPLVRSPREEFALSLAFTVQNGQTFTFAGPTPFSLGPDKEGNSRTRVVKFGQDYVARDIKGAWALRSLFSLGIGSFDATINSDPTPDGRFFSWLAQIQRAQKLSDNNTLIAQAEVQLTPNSLLPSQQFVVGGGQSVRGYRQNARAGDNGVRFSLEDRITVQKDESGNSVLQLAPFFDAGVIWNVDNNPNTLQKQNFLAGVGLGVLWQPVPSLNVRLDYGLPLVNLDDRGQNAQDDGFYFSVGYKL
jgi:hemolysin activation/secretion protein